MSSPEVGSTQLTGVVTELINQALPGDSLILSTVVSPGNIHIHTEPGSAPVISSDPDNRAAYGSDNGLFVPELIADPLAYYILAKS